MGDARGLALPLLDGGRHLPALFMKLLRKRGYAAVTGSLPSALRQTECGLAGCGKTISAQQNFDGGMCGTSPVVWFIWFVLFIWFIWLVSFNQTST